MDRKENLVVVSWALVAGALLVGVTQGQSKYATVIKEGKKLLV